MTTTQPSDPRSRVFPPGVAVVATLIGVGLQYLLPFRLISQPAGRWIGGAFILAWLGLAASALGVFRGAGTTANPTGEVTAFVIGGPYRYTRNPMYLGLILLQIGVAFVLGNGWILLLTVAAFIVLDRLVIAGEERYLAAKYGAAYDDYRRKVRRWL